MTQFDFNRATDLPRPAIPHGLNPEEITADELLRDFLFEGLVMPVDSSTISTLQYLIGTESIVLSYLSGERWRYFHYSVAEAMDLFYAPSKGTWSWDHIRVRGEGNKHLHQRNAIQLS